MWGLFFLICLALAIWIGLFIQHSSFFTFQNTLIEGQTFSERVTINRENNITYRNCVFRGTSGHGLLWIQESSNIIIEDCDFRVVAGHSGQGDAIYSQLNDGNIYRNNFIVMEHTSVSSHSDAIQCFSDANGEISGNSIILKAPKTYNNQGIYCTNNEGVWNISSNVVIDSLLITDNSLITFHNVDNTGGGAVIMDNILFGGTFGSLHLNNVGDAVVMGNTICATAQDAKLIKYYGNNAEFSGNFYNFLNSAKPFDRSGSAKSFPEWQALGFDLDSEVIPECREPDMPSKPPAPADTIKTVVTVRITVNKDATVEVLQQ
jgi:hypothetical protein